MLKIPVARKVGEPCQQESLAQAGRAAPASGIWSQVRLWYWLILKVQESLIICGSQWRIEPVMRIDMFCVILC